MKDDRLLLEGIYAMIEEMREKSSRSEAINPSESTVDFSEITTLIKHWKTQSVEQTVNMEKSLTEKLDNLAAIANTTSNPDERLDRIIEILQQPSAKPQPQRHHHVIDLKSSKTVRYILIQWVIIYLFLGWSIWLTGTNLELRDNDLKYRYIKSANPNNEFIHHLEKVFKYDRNRKEIRNIRKKVKKFEDEVGKRTERIETGEAK
jgi:hypothetical protein